MICTVTRILGSTYMPTLNLRRPMAGMNGRTFAALYLGPTGNLQCTVKALDIDTGCVKKVKTFDVVLMLDRVIDTVNKRGQKYQKEKKKKMGKFLDRLKREFAWENDEYEYDIPEGTLVHPEIDAEFSGILMNGDDEERDLGLDDHDESDEELIRRV